MRVIEKYLKQYAEPEAQSVANLQPTGSSYENVVVIPAYREEIDFIDRFVQLSHSRPSKLLLILVINQKKGSPKCNKNRALYEYVLNLGDVVWHHENLNIVSTNNADIFLVDRFSSEHQIPEKKGVGLARKIGCDIAVALQESIQSTWIYSSDADAHLPENYFSSPLTDEHNSAIVFEFEHIPPKNSATTIENKLTQNTFAHATKLYEKAIKYYRSALEWAGSPYCFYTLGSTTAIHLESYCKVRGFPKRPAGEDFYLLNKLAKLGEVAFNPNIKIEIDARPSDRVPFGTGPAVGKIVALAEPEKEYTYYAPQIFSDLKLWLEYRATLWQHLVLDHNNNSLTLDPIPLAFESLPTRIRDIVIELGITQFLEHALKQCKTFPLFEKAFHDWFDGFQTLKFVHLMQDRHYPAIPLESVLVRSKEMFK